MNKPTMRKKPAKASAHPTAHDTIFDDVYRTILQKLPFLVIAVINEVFGTDYDEDADYEQLRNEHLEIAGKIITDSIFRLGDRIFHMECQSAPDGTMAIRMFEYDFAIALEDARKQGKPYRFAFPLSAVLYLRQPNEMPDKLTVDVSFPDEQQVTYAVPVIKLQEYPLEEIFRKRLLMFLPYYIMRYERQFAAMEQDKTERAVMMDDLREIAHRLLSDPDARHRDSYADLIRLIQQIADRMLENRHKMRKEVSGIMGGKILELHSERMKRLGRKEGRKEGHEAGLKEGHRDGVKESRETFALAMLRDHMPMEMIVKYSCLSMEDINRIAQTNGVM